MSKIVFCGGHCYDQYFTLTNIDLKYRIHSKVTSPALGFRFTIKLILTNG